MKLIGIIGIIGLSLLIIGILFLLWQKKKFRGPTTPLSPQGAQPTQPQPSKHWSWNDSIKATVIISLLIASIVVLFWTQVKNTAEMYPLIAVGTAIAAAILLIGGDSQKTIRRGRIIAVIIIIATLSSFVFWPAAGKKFPWLKTIGNDSSHISRKVSYSPSSATLPRNAAFVKTLAPGERIYLTRANMAAPPPKFFARFNGRFVETFDTWPQSARHRFAANNTSQSYDFYVTLAPGQNFTTSAIDPALKQVAQAPSASDCLLDRAFGPK